MAIRRNADGSITVGIIPEEKPAKNEPTPEVKKTAPKKAATKKTK